MHMNLQNVTVRGGLLRARREQKKIRQMDLAAEVGINKSNLCDIEKDRINPSADVLLRLMIRLKIKPADFF